MHCANRHIPLLITFLLVLGLRGACYASFIGPEPEHACCSSEAVECNVTDSACCDDIAPEPNKDVSTPPAVVVEIIELETLATEDLTPQIWVEVIRPPPDELRLSKALASRAPPLS